MIPCSSTNLDFFFLRDVIVSNSLVRSGISGVGDRVTGWTDGQMDRLPGREYGRAGRDKQEHMKKRNGINFAPPRFCGLYILPFPN